MHKRIRYRLSVSENPSYSSGFTIVELLVVIVIIAILAAITVVSYTGITNKATVASIQSDLDNASKQLKLYYTDNGYYPSSINGSYCPSPSDPNGYCLKTSNGATLDYQPNNTTNVTEYSLYSTKNSVIYRISSDTGMSPTSVTKVCPYGFISVPGSSTYGTSDFCVMKYEAKQYSSTVPISQASSTPWVSINQIGAGNYSQNVAGCTGCHLITEAEWLTIAQNVLSVPSNWSTGIVGSGYIYSGHNDSVPNNSLAASTNDLDGYYGTSNTTGNQKRTLTLTNGEVIWDLAGNVFDWASDTTTGGQPGITGESAYAWKEWTAITAPGSLSPNPNPATTGISGANSWNSSNGVGQLYSNAGETVTRGFRCGGAWNFGSNAGVLSLALSYLPTNAGGGVGFRVAK